MTTAAVAPSRRQRWLLAAYAVVAAVHLVTQLTGPPGLVRGTQAVAMPLLVAVVVADHGAATRLLRLVVAALFFSWLGDVLPALLSDEVGVYVLIGCFLVAQLIYSVAFWPFRHRSLAGTPWFVAYVAGIAAVVAICAPGSGPMLPAVVVYAVAIGLMAVLASGVHRRALLGAVLFLLSDALIAIGLFAPGLAIPAAGFWVMLTYLSAQLLIVLARFARRRVLQPTQPPHLDFGGRHPRPEGAGSCSQSRHRYASAYSPAAVTPPA